MIDYDPSATGRSVRFTNEITVSGAGKQLWASGPPWRIAKMADQLRAQGFVIRETVPEDEPHNVDDIILAPYLDEDDEPRLHLVIDLNNERAYEAFETAVDHERWRWPPRLVH